jgi:hypothetical protein
MRTFSSTSNSGCTFWNFKMYRLAGTDPGWIGARKHSRRSCDTQYDDESDQERIYDGHVKDQQTPDEGAHEHSCHCYQASACSRSASAGETAVCRDADDGQGEDGRRQVGHSELARGGVLQSHRDAQHDDETIALGGFLRIAGQRGQDYRSTQQDRLQRGGDAKQPPPVLTKVRPKESSPEGAEYKRAQRHQRGQN